MSGASLLLLTSLLLSADQIGEANPPSRLGMSGAGTSAPQTKEEIAQREAKAKAAFEALEPEFERFQQMQIPMSTKNAQLFASRLLEKMKALTELQDKYAKVLQLGSPEWGIASLVRIGDLSWELAEQLDAAPPPSSYPDLKQALDGLYDPMSEPLRTKAVDAYQAASAKAAEQKISNEYVARAKRRLEAAKKPR
jgi:hypothetical protein